MFMVNRTNFLAWTVGDLLVRDREGNCIVGDDAANEAAVQGEIAGPGIQKNHYGLKERTLFVFNVYDIDAGSYLDFERFLSFCADLKLQTVPIADSHLVLNWTVEQAIEAAKGQYPSGYAREGIVVRPHRERYSQVLGGRASFKVINNDYLLRQKD